jgi:FkbM family methyltransferase
MGIVKKLFGSTTAYKKWQEKKLASYKKNKELNEKILTPERKKFYHQFINAGDLVFDVGANEGNRVQVFLDLKANIVAVEPQPNCIEILKQKFDNKIIIEQVGLSNESGELEMFIANDSTISSFSSEFIDKTSSGRFSNYSWEQKIKVPVVTMDSLIEKYGIPKFCKIDVEGFEINVLKGLNHQIPFLSFEYCVPEMQEKMHECIVQLHKISPLGKFNYSVEESMKLELSDWVSFEDFLSISKSDLFISSLFGDIYFKSI